MIDLVIMRERDRERAAARAKAGKNKDDGLTPEQRRERDAKALQEKQAKKAAGAAGGNSSGEACLVAHSSTSLGHQSYTILFRYIFLMEGLGLGLTDKGLGWIDRRGIDDGGGWWWKRTQKGIVISTSKILFYTPHMCNFLSNYIKFGVQNVIFEVLITIP
ncbi:hypothetical protein ACFX19_032065 [Malus domestica]|uniref:Small EDRK-rich factor-like N-terminal domain-containing protein n=1 Tax=Malus domestica TaxID=3750 RepID=A0A498K2H7_MALDO|nr:hypothetical protein DVH24_000728 [Malus domestica]